MLSSMIHVNYAIIMRNVNAENAILIKIIFPKSVIVIISFLKITTIYLKLKAYLYRRVYFIISL